jgi:hypothetical protein
MSYDFSKASIYTTLSEKVKATNGTIVGIGGDNYVCLVDDEIRLSVSIKESEAKERLWVGVPNPILNGMLNGVKLPQEREIVKIGAERTFILLQHRKCFLVIPMKFVFQDILDRYHSDGNKIRFDFDVIKKGYRRYVILAGETRPDITIPEISSFDSLWNKLDTPIK